VPFHSATA